MSPQKPRKRTPAARQRRSKRQAERNPMLGVRVPKALYTQLQQWAKADSRTLADWLRLHLHELEPNAAVRDIAAMNKRYEDAFTKDRSLLTSITVPAGVQEPTEPAK